jgi:hypothetical protein
VPDAVRELLATEVALRKLGARNISADEAGQLQRNRHVIVRNPHGAGEQDRRRLITGTTDGGRVLTLVIERTIGSPRGLGVNSGRDGPGSALVCGAFAAGASARELRRI